MSSTLAQPDTIAPPAAKHGLRLARQAADVDAIELPVETTPLRDLGPEEVLVEIHAAAVNPSDVKAATGLMPYAVFPRTPGRDYAGRVVAGPPALLGSLVFGSSGDLGIRVDGSHSSHMIVEADAVVPVPPGIDVKEAAGIGVPFVTALEGLRKAGLPSFGETVLVLGSGGKVGQAVTQIATWRGARVIGVDRTGGPYAGHANGPVEVLSSTADDLAARVREMTDGKGADIVFNTVGDPLYEMGQASMAVGGRAVFIAAVKRFVTFDILAFYKGRHVYVGVDTISLGSVESGSILKELAPGFAAGKLKPFPVVESAIYAMENAHAAYRAVIRSSRDRIVLVPKG